MTHSKKNRRSRHALNKIDYIVYGNPSGAKQLLLTKGFKTYPNVRHNAAAIKQWVKEKGRNAIKDLLYIHPDKQVLLKLHREKEDSFCGACSNYTYHSGSNHCSSCGYSNFSEEDKNTLLDELRDMSTLELKTYYKSLLKKSNQQPEDVSLAEEVQVVFNELKDQLAEGGKEDESKQTRTSFITHNEALVLGLTLITGVLIGSQLK